MHTSTTHSSPSLDGTICVCMSVCICSLFLCSVVCVCMREKEGLDLVPVYLDTTCHPSRPPMNHNTRGLIPKYRGRFSPTQAAAAAGNEGSALDAHVVLQYVHCAKYPTHTEHSTGKSVSQHASQPARVGLTRSLTCATPVCAPR